MKATSGLRFFFTFYLFDVFFGSPYTPIHPTQIIIIKKKPENSASIDLSAIYSHLRKVSKKHLYE